MGISKLNRRRIGCAMTSTAAIAAALFGTAAYGQTVQPPQPLADQSLPATPAAAGTSDGADIIVTGSLIRGAREDNALPVDVIGREELERQGSPTLVDLLKALPGSNGILGESNQFDGRSSGAEGSGSVNLRGLGAERTLVLLNGRRIASNPVAAGGSGIVDTNTIPVAAIGRIEVLKDGAAATYGSDAIGGVVNFITRDDLKGLELGADYRFVAGSDDDYSLRAVYGWQKDGIKLLLAAGHQHRSELSTRARDFFRDSYAQNPEGGYTAGGNPGSFLSSAGTLFRDPGCADLGGTPGFSGTTPVCYNRYIDYDNLVETENRYQLFGSASVKVNDSAELYVDGMYSHTDVPEYNTSPSYIILASPSADAQQSGLPGFLQGRYYVPRTNPGLVDFAARNPGLAASVANGAAVLAPAARPLLLGGNPLFDNGGAEAQRRYDAYRISGGVRGEFGASGISYDFGLTYSQEKVFFTNFDTLANRYALALRGFGGPNCDTQPNAAGIQGPGGGAAVAGANGCQYFNPFASAIQSNAITGQVNPNFNPALTNSNELISWFFQERQTRQKSQLFVADALVSGSTGIKLPGGTIKFALGGQYRKDYYDARFSDLNNELVNPCISSPDFFNNSCTGAQRNGPFVFLGTATPKSLTNDVYAGFAELRLPVFERLNFQLAARYESYGGQVGSTFNPKIAGKWQVVDGIAIRGSAGTTFRGPPTTQLIDGNSATALSSILGSFRAVDVFGNPALSPEKANTYNAGLLVNFGGFRGSIDYYRFDFKDAIVAEPVSGIVNAVFPNGATGTNNCANPALAALVNRFTFIGACSAANISRLRTQYVNGADINTSGIDVVADYDIDDVFGGRLGLGVNATYVIEYKTGAQLVEGVSVAPGFEAAGFLNYQTTAFPIPQIKGQGYVEYTNGPHNLRVSVNYVDGYTDQRTGPFATNAFRNADGSFFTNTDGKEIGSYTTIDATYRVKLPIGAALTFSVDNVFDKAPPFARLDLSYDPFTADALGRTFKLGVSGAF